MTAVSAVTRYHGRPCRTRLTGLEELTQPRLHDRRRKEYPTARAARLFQLNGALDIQTVVSVADAK